MIQTSAFAMSKNENEQIPFQSYTYWENYSGSSKKAVFNKPIYETYTVIDSGSLNLKSRFEEITDIYTSNSRITYILDGKSSKVVFLNPDYTYKGEFSGITNNKETLLYKNASGIYATDDGEVFIADTDNERVIVCDETGICKKIFYLPKSKLIPSSFKYKPIKVAMDSRGYLYVLSDGSYYGALLYSPDGDFLGFYGANNVKSSISDVITKMWNKLILNDKKRSSLESKLPYQFTDLFIDNKDFVFTATGNTSTITNGDEQTGQIRKLSPGGKDVLNSDSVNYGDDDNGHYNQDILGVAVDGSGFIYALDSAYGHIFVYDQKNNLLGAFGCGTRAGKQKGSFTSAVAVSLNGTDVIVADSSHNNITVFKETDYGKKLKKAQALTNKGNYNKAKDIWKDIFSQDKNNQLAYKGLAKAYYESEDYKSAMKYAKIGCDRDTYAIAYKEIRNNWINKNFICIVLLIVFTVILLIFVFKKIKKKNKKILPVYISNSLSVWGHPSIAFDTLMKNKKTGAVLSVVFSLLFYVTTVMKDMLSGFCFTYFNSSDYNALFVLARTVGLVLVASLCYWAVSTLMLGRGKLIDIFIVISHSLQPIILSNIIYLILTNFALPSELGFLNILTYCLFGYSAFIAILGLMRISDYGFYKFLGVTLLTVGGIVCILFVGIVVFLLFQTFIEFLKTIASEIYKIIVFGS